MQQQERYMTQNGSYFEFSNSAGTTTPAIVPFKTYSGENTNGNYYLSAIACPLNTNLKMCIQVSAEPKQADDAAGTLILDTTGLKTCSVSGSKVCW
jgi:Tfp pilus assembly protein PilE